MLDQSLSHTDSHRFTLFFIGSHLSFVILILECLNPCRFLSCKQLLLLFRIVLSQLLGPCSELFQIGRFEIDFSQTSSVLVFVLLGLNRRSHTSLFSSCLEDRGLVFGYLFSLIAIFILQNMIITLFFVLFYKCRQTPPEK